MLRVILLAKCSSIFSVRGKYCDGASKERKRTIRKKALKFSVSSRGELFYRQKRKGKANMCSSCKHFIWNPFLVNTQVDWAFSYRWGMMWHADKADNTADEMGGGGGGGVMLHKHPVQWQTMQTIVQMDQL